MRGTQHTFLVDLLVPQAHPASWCLCVSTEWKKPSLSLSVGTSRADLTLDLTFKTSTPIVQLCQCVTTPTSRLVFPGFFLVSRVLLDGTRNECALTPRSSFGRGFPVAVCPTIHFSIKPSIQ
ncbi:hypothetical protein EDB87DRAFT_340536 [Lactarius vividus]|nr:hypothetical protein EDB87DRAFT_340536 [Lactarius vividus]